MDRKNGFGFADILAFGRQPMTPNSNEIHARFLITLEPVESDFAGWLRETIFGLIGDFAWKISKQGVEDEDNGTTPAM